MNEGKYILSEESAKDQIDIIMDYYDIDLDDFDGQVRKAMDQAVRTLIKGARLGLIEVESEGGLKVIQHLIEPPGDVNTLEYGPVTGKNKLAMKDNSSQHERCYQFVGAITKAGEKAISSLKARDLRYCEALSALFLSA
jgi:hypothetical protein